MQTQSSNWLEIVKAVGPYITAIVAIIISALTASLTHRNWLKQFSVEKTFAFRDEQRSLLKEIPAKLIQASYLVVQSLIWQGMLTVLISFVKEGKVPDDPEKMNALHERHHQAVQQFSTVVTELYISRITARVYFGEDAGRAVESCLATLQGITIVAPEYKAAQSELYVNLKTALEDKEVSEDMTKMILQFNQRMVPLIDQVGNEVAKLVRLMLDRIGGESPRGGVSMPAKAA
jgi:hypothetical protein